MPHSFTSGHTVGISGNVLVFFALSTDIRDLGKEIILKNKSSFYLFDEKIKQSSLCAKLLSITGDISTKCTVVHSSVIILTLSEKLSLQCPQPGENYL